MMIGIGDDDRAAGVVTVGMVIFDSAADYACSASLSGR